MMGRSLSPAPHSRTSVVVRFYVAPTPLSAGFKRQPATPGLIVLIQPLKLAHLLVKVLLGIF